MEFIQSDNYIHVPEVVAEYTEVVSDSKESSCLLENKTNSENECLTINNTDINSSNASPLSVLPPISYVFTHESSISSDSHHSIDNFELSSDVAISGKVLTLPVPGVTRDSTDGFCTDLSPTSISQEASYCSLKNDIDETINMISETGNQTSPDPSCDSTDKQESTLSKPSHCLPPCRICGERASGFHYGVNTCEACKGFFRRSIKRINQYKCVESNNNCVIEPGKRNSCPKCRFDKCLKVGMSKSAIKTGRYTHEKRSRDIREIKKLEKQQCPINDIVVNPNIEEAKKLATILVQAQKDMYGKNYEFWISNEMIRNLAEEYQKQYKVKTEIFGDLNKLPEDEFKNFYNTTGIDIDNRIELMSEIATTLENGVSRYINFVKAIPGFTALCLEDQAALIKASRFEFWFIGYQRFVCSDLGVTTGIMQQCHHKSELAKVIGMDFVDELFYHSKKVQNLNLTTDEIAVLRSFVVFSPDRCGLKDRDAVETIQWKLLICMKYLFELNHRPEEHYLSKVMDRVACLRVITELNEKRAECIKLEWPVMKNHPLLLELMSG